MVITVVVLHPLNVSYLAYILVFAFFNSRELLLDFRDKYADDKFCKTKSLPTLLESNFFMLILALLIVALYVAMLLNNFFAVIFVILNISGFLFCYWIGFNRISLNYLAQYQLFLFVGILFIQK